MPIALVMLLIGLCILLGFIMAVLLVVGYLMLGLRRSSTTPRDPRLLLVLGVESLLFGALLCLLPIVLAHPAIHVLSFSSNEVTWFFVAGLISGLCGTSVLIGQAVWRLAANTSRSFANSDVRNKPKRSYRSKLREGAILLLGISVLFFLGTFIFGGDWVTAVEVGGFVLVVGLLILPPMLLIIVLSPVLSVL